MDDDDEEGEDGGDDDSGVEGGFLPSPWPPPPGEPSPLGGLELSPYILTFLSSYRTLTISVISKNAFLNALSSSGMIGYPS